MIKGIDIASREQETFQKVASGTYRYYGDKKTEDKEGEISHVSTYYEDHAYAGISALDFMKKCRLQELMDRDNSSAINEFMIGDQPVWLDKATRSGLDLRLKAEKAKSKTTTTLWYKGIQFTLDIDIAISMLLAIEVYASECYDNTQRIAAAIEEMDSAEDVFTFDITQGYPDKLKF